MRARPRLAAAAADVGAVLMFVAAGRRSHAEDDGVLVIAAPFLVGVALGWLVVLRTGRRPAAWSTGAIVWAITVAVGMLLRRLAWGRGTAAAFVVVATLVLGTLLLGWRGVWTLMRSRGALRSSRPPAKAER